MPRRVMRRQGSTLDSKNLTVLDLDLSITRFGSVLEDGDLGTDSP